jgi:hypothetical protein
MPSKKYPNAPQWRAHLHSLADVDRVRKMTIKRLKDAAEHGVGATVRCICATDEIAQMMQLSFRSIGLDCSHIVPLQLRSKLPKLTKGSLNDWRKLSKAERQRTPRPGRTVCDPTRAYMVGFMCTADQLASMEFPEEHQGVLIAVAQPGQIYQAVNLAKPSWKQLTE